MRSPRIAAAFLLSLGAGAAIAQNIATLGKVGITAAELTQLAARQPELRRQMLASDEALERIVRQELIRRALLEQAEAKGWDKRPEVAARLEQARERVLLAAFLDGLAQPPRRVPGRGRDQGVL